MADLRLNIRATNTAPRELQQLRRKVDRLQQTMGQTNRSAQQASQGINQVGRSAGGASQQTDRFGDEATAAAIGMDNLGHQTFRTSAEARRFGGVFQDTNGPYVRRMGVILLVLVLIDFREVSNPDLRCSLLKTEWL